MIGDDGSASATSVACTGITGEGLCATAKLGRAGLNKYFALGGYGSDSADRTKLTECALQRAAEVLGHEIDLSRAYVVGDTPLDVSCARTIGARVAAVATGWHSLDELKACGPDLLLPDLSDPQPILALCR